MKPDKADEVTNTTETTEEPKPVERAKAINKDIHTHTTELVEAAGLTELRETCTELATLRLGKTPDTPFMLKLGFLPKGTKASKSVDGSEVDVVLKPYEIFETTKDAKPFNIIMLNERLGLSSTRAPLSNTEAVNRLIGPVCYGITEMIYPPEINKKGARIITAEHRRAHEALGFNKWYQPNGTLNSAHRSSCNMVTLPVDAFELPEPVKANEERMTYRLTITNIKSKVTYKLTSSKALYENERTVLSTASEALKELGLSIELIAVEASATAKADAAAKSAKRAGELDRSKEAEAARESKRTEDTEALAAFISAKSSKSSK